MQFFTENSGGPEFEQACLRDLLLNFGLVRDFLVKCRFALCGQREKKQDAILNHIDRVAADSLINAYKEHVKLNDFVFSNQFQIAFKKTLKNIVRQKKFTGTTINDFSKKIIDKLNLDSRAGFIHTRLRLYHENNDLINFCKSIENFLDNDAEQKINANYQATLKYFMLEKVQNITERNMPRTKHALVYEMISFVLYYTENISRETALMMASVPILAAGMYTVGGVIYNRWVDHTELDNELAERYNSLVKIHKITWPEYHPKTPPSLLPDSIEVQSLSTDDAEPATTVSNRMIPPYLEEEQPPNQGRRKKRPSKSTGRHDKVEIARPSIKKREVIRFLGTNYIYNPGNLKESNVFPIGGSMIDTFFVTIHSQIISDIDEKNDADQAEQIAGKFQNKVSNGVKFSHTGENLCSIGRIADPNTKKTLLCYELRILGFGGDHRLLGVPVNLFDKDGNHYCLIELNTYCKGAHKGNALSRSVEEVKVKGMGLG